MFKSKETLHYHFTKHSYFGPATRTKLVQAFTKKI